MAQLPSGELVEVTNTIQLRSSGIKMYGSYEGTSWNTEITAGGVRVGSVEIRRDGIWNARRGRLDWLAAEGVFCFWRRLSLRTVVNYALIYRVV